MKHYFEKFYNRLCRGIKQILLVVFLYIPAASWAQTSSSGQCPEECPLCGSINSMEYDETAEWVDDEGNDRVGGCVCQACGHIANSGVNSDIPTEASVLPILMGMVYAATKYVRRRRRETHRER